MGAAEVARAGGHAVRLTNLDKLFWPERGITKRGLLEYHTAIAPALLPHIGGRAMVMKRYPNGAAGKFFFMKRAPSPGAEFPQVLEAALVVHAALDGLGMPNLAKTTGSRGIRLYVPIERGPLQKQVWTFAKAFAQTMAARNPALITAEYTVAKRPERRAVVDYNQNAWGRTLASVDSPRPRPLATVSAPVRWEEVARGIRTEDFRIGNMPARIAEVGDLWEPLDSARGRFRLEKLL
jgi:DNA primase